MIASLRVKSVALMTNNPRKIQGLENMGIKVSKRLAHIMQPNEFNAFYLQTKQQKSGHLLQEQGEQPES